MYRIMQGVQGNNESVYIFATNLPQSLNIHYCKAIPFGQRLVIYSSLIIELLIILLLS